MTSQPTLFTQTIGRKRSLGLTLGISLALLIAPFLIAYMDGVWDVFINQGVWRIALVQPVVIIYILVVAPILEGMGTEVIQSFRSIVKLDDESYWNIVRRAERIPRSHELLAIAIGGAIGFWMAYSGSFSRQALLFSIYWLIFNTIMLGLIAWIVYLSIASTRLTAALHRQPLEFDLFDLSPFIPIGRQSLALSLVFVGGVLLSLLLGVQPESLLIPQFWLTYIPLLVVPVLVFFLNMQPTHRLLSKEKTRHLEFVQTYILKRTHDLEAHLKAGVIPAEFSSEFSTLAMYQAQLQSARTYPYKTAQLRTLFFSVLIPAVTMLARTVIENFLSF